MPLDRYQMAEHFQTGVNLTKAYKGERFVEDKHALGHKPTARLIR
jgi:hypothetical protein